MKKQHLLSLLLLLLVSLPSIGQSNADLLIEKLKKKTDQIQAFEVDAIIKVDVDFINIKDRELTINYKAPGEFTFDAKGLLLLPKNGVQMEYMTLFNNSHTALEAGQETIAGTKTVIIKVIPESMESDIILAQLWIDPLEERILRMKTFTKTSGSYVINFEYAKTGDSLPSILEVTFEISNMSIPVKMMNDFMSQSGTESDSPPKDAKVIIEYSDYKITYMNPEK